MYLAIPIILLLGPFAAGAPSFQHTQTSVDVTHTNPEPGGRSVFLLGKAGDE